MREAWVVDCVDQRGTRRLKTFESKRDADAFNATTVLALRAGTHAADRASTTVAKAGELWLTEGAKRGLERSSLDRNARHVRLHINPFLGSQRPNQLTAPRVKEFETNCRRLAARPHSFAAF